MGNTQQTELSFDAKLEGNFVIYVAVETNKGFRYVTYRNGNKAPHLEGNQSIHYLSDTFIKKQWSHFTRDIQTDLMLVEPDILISRIDNLLIRGDGRLSNASLANGNNQVQLKNWINDKVHNNQKTSETWYHKSENISYRKELSGVLTQVNHNDNGIVTSEINFENLQLSDV